jgi:hypothetical protein
MSNSQYWATHRSRGWGLCQRRGAEGHPGKAMPDLQGEVFSYTTELAS